MSAYLIRADARRLPLRDGSVDCVVTSPPYWGLRDYGAGGQIGLEPNPDSYVSEVVTAMDECRRVLRPRGTLWLNLGDSYSTQAGEGTIPGGGRQGQPWQRINQTRDPKSAGGREPMWQPNRRRIAGLKPKDLVGIPWRVAFALQAAGWWLRSDIIWSKPNPMPESITDRPTRSHEYLFLFAKSERYWYDADAIREPHQVDSNRRFARMRNPGHKYDVSATGHGWNGDLPQKWNERARRLKEAEARAKTAGPGPHVGGRRQAPEPGQPGAFHANGRNARSVWTIATQPYSGAHFATFPEELARRCILAACPIGGLVLDPFAGSGTVGRVAIENGRNAVLCDLAYQDLAKRRTFNVQRPLAATS